MQLAPLLRLYQQWSQQILKENTQTKLYNATANFDFVYSVFIYFFNLILGGWKHQSRTMVCPFGATSAWFSSSSLTVAPLWGSTLIAPLFLDDVINPHCSTAIWWLILLQFALLAQTLLLFEHYYPIFALKETKPAVKMSLVRFMCQRFEQHQLPVIILICLFCTLVDDVINKVVWAFISITSGTEQMG